MHTLLPRLLSRRAPRVLACAASALVLAACSSLPPAGTSASASPSPSPTTATTMPSSTASSLLFAYHWDLDRAVDARGADQPQLTRTAPQAPVRLRFVQGEGGSAARLSVANLCNTMSAGVDVAGDTLRVGRPVATMRACSDAQLMARERLVGQQLGSIRQWKLVAADAQPGQQPRLELGLADGSTWLLQGTPTDETRYGGQPERVFLEVAPQRVACSHPLMPNHRCLQVRTVRYADNGIRQSVGEWEAFYSEIQGYQHVAGVRNVLRVNRYEPRNRPADASRYVYVLDMAVESEIVP